MAPFDRLDRGDKVDLHVHLFERYVEVLDGLCTRYNISRAAAIEALIDEYADAELTPSVRKRLGRPLNRKGT